MERFTEKLEDGRSILHRGFSGKVEFGFMTFVKGNAIEKLSRCEDLEEKTGSTFEECAEELAKYRAIGTVSECRNAVSKTKVMKAKPFCSFSEDIKTCPRCENILISYKQEYCHICGQAILWEDDDE